MAEAVAPIRPGRYRHNSGSRRECEVLAVVAHPSCAAPLVVYWSAPGRAAWVVPEDEFSAAWSERFTRLPDAPQGGGNG